MKKNLAKIIALLMALVLVFSFAACGGKDDEPSTDPSNDVSNSEDANTPDNSNEDPSNDVDAPSEDDPSGDVDAPSNDDPTDPANSDKPQDPTKPNNPQDPTKPTGGNDNKPSNPGNSGIAKPEGKDAGVKLYNDALGKSSWKKTYVKRELTKTNAKIFGKDTDLNSLGPVSQMFADGSGNVNAKLAKLNAGDVAGYQVGQSGNNWVMTFTLKSGVNATNANHGVSGYMYFLTMQEVSDVIVNIGKAIGGDSFKIEINKAKSSITLNGGKLVVNVDKNTGKITTATLSFTEDINGQCKALGSIPVTANLQGKGTVTFTYA